MALMFDPDGIGFYDTGTGALGLPRGKTSERPPNPRPGYMRYNTELKMIEIYGNTANTSNANTWGTYLAGDYYAEVLVVGGGGAGSGPGGGAGGLIYASSMLFSTGTSYQVTVGAGGSGGSGSYSSINGVIALGGGGARQIGGSGGGGQWAGHNQWGTIYPGTTGQGNPGGSGYHNHDWGHSYGGGGGAGAGGGWGATSPGGQSGAGGAGLSYSISGVATHYAGGGAGGQGGRSWYGNSSQGGGGGVWGGLAGGNRLGGGGCDSNGGSGIVIIKYNGEPRGVGGATAWYPDQFQTPASGFTTHTFTETTYYRA